jgi:hypothetical protein
MVSESPDFAGVDWQAYSTAPNFTLSIGSGTKTVYFKVKNDAGESRVINDGIILIVQPILTSFQINEGAAMTSSRAVKLNYATGEPDTSYMASESSSFNGAVWKTYSASPAFTLSRTKGTKTVYFKVRNAAGVSNVMSSTIILN